MVHTTKDTEGIPAPTISIFPYSKNNSLFRLSSEKMEELYRGDLPSEDYLTKNTYNQSEALIDIFLGFERKMSLLDRENMVFEELTRPSLGRYYVFRPSFTIALLVKAHQEWSIEILDLCLSFYRRPDISDRYYNLTPHFRWGIKHDT